MRKFGLEGGNKDMVWPLRKKEELEPTRLDSRPLRRIEASQVRQVVQPTKPRKAPPKPWGKKERYLVATILAITIIASLVGYVTSQGFALPELYLPDISTDKTIEIEK